MSNETQRTMRAKMVVGLVQEHRYAKVPGGPVEKTMETVSMSAVAASKYPDDGTDEDNDYARWSPGASLTINIANPALFGKIKHGDRFYVDFTPAS